MPDVFHQRCTGFLELPLLNLRECVAFVDSANLHRRRSRPKSKPMRKPTDASLKMPPEIAVDVPEGAACAYEVASCFRGAVRRIEGVDGFELVVSFRHSVLRIDGRGIGCMEGNFTYIACRALPLPSMRKRRGRP